MVTREKFAAELASLDVAAIAEMIKKETGKKITKTSHAEAVDQAYEFYAIHAARHKNAPAAETPTAAAQMAPPGSQLPSAGGAIAYEVRAKRPRGMYRFGIYFGPVWHAVQLTAEQALEISEGKHPYLQVRVKV